MNYSNPRTEAVVHNWPHGALRTTAHFAIERHPTRGERATRTTIDPKTGRTSKPKALTYARRSLIVDGDDGRTYIASLTEYSMISIMRGDMAISQESINDTDARYAGLLSALTAGVQS